MKYLTIVLVLLCSSVAASPATKYGETPEYINSEKILKTIIENNANGMLGVVIPPYTIIIGCHYLKDMKKTFDIYSDDTMKKYIAVATRLKHDRQCSTVRVPSVAVEVIDSHISKIENEIRYVHLYKILTINKETIYSMFSAPAELEKI